MFRLLLSTAAAALLAAPAVFAGGPTAGSAGIFPIHRTGIGAGAFTVLSLTNTNTNPIDGATLIHYEYVNVVENPNNALLPLACVIFDRIALLTPADTLSVLTNCHNPAFGVQGGYVSVAAQDPNAFNTNWSFNFLVGSELVINSSGAAYSLNMIPFLSPLDQGLATDEPANGGNGNGAIDYDDREYEAGPDRLIMDSFIAKMDSNLVLINLTGGDQAINTVIFNVWNDNEFPLSVTIQFKCWFDQPLSVLSPLFTEVFLADNTPDDRSELDIDCDGFNDFETGWAIIDSIDLSQPNGTFIANDGALLGAISSGPKSVVDGGRVLWQSAEKQYNGSFLLPGFIVNDPGPLDPVDPCPPDQDPKVTICHAPPGNPSNAHTISVGVSALPAHLAHGDSLGACDG